MGELGWCNPFSCTLYYRVHATVQEAFHRPIIPASEGCLEEEEEEEGREGRETEGGARHPRWFCSLIGFLLRV